jgi:cell division protein FtsB
MKKKVNINERKIIQGLFILCSLIVIILSVVGDKGFLQLHELKQTESALIKEVKELRQERRIWVKKIESIRNNQTYLETYAREELGMIKNNEILLKLVPKRNESN